MLASAGIGVTRSGYVFNIGQGTPELGQFNEGRHVMGACGAAALFRREVFEIVGDFDEDLAHYLTASGQIPSAVGLGVRVAPDGGVSTAGGFLLQTLSPADDALIDTLTERIATMPPITELLRRGQTPEALLAILFTGIPFDTLEKRALAFQCACSRKRMERALAGLGRPALAGIIAGPGEAAVTCEFCRRRYHFHREALAQLMGAIPS